MHPYHDAAGPVVVMPSSPQYLLNNGFGAFISAATNKEKAGTARPNNHAPLRSTSGERSTIAANQHHHYGSTDGVDVVPYRLNAQTMNYSTISRSLTPMDNNMTSSGPSDSKSGYFQNQNSSMNLLNN